MTITMTTGQAPGQPRNNGRSGLVLEGFLVRMLSPVIGGRAKDFVHLFVAPSWLLGIFSTVIKHRHY